MQIKKAENMGFCMGVRRAMQIVHDIIDSKPECPVYTFGPLIHNRLVLDDLKRKGVSVLEKPEKGSGIVIIRAHGVQPEVKEILEKKCKKLVDATCPRVLHSQKKVYEASGEGRHVVIAGDRDHGEVKGIAGYAESVDIVQTADDAEKLSISENTLVISQTTFSEKDYEDICSTLSSKVDKIEIIHSICPATEKRQNALIKLLDEVEAVIVIGGKNSANTRRLYHTALNANKNSWHIEEAGEIPPEIGNFSVIGLTAGASTPDWIIKEVEDKLNSY